MKLNEILEKPIKNLKQGSKPTTDLLRHSNLSAVGVGAQAIAYMHQKFPDKIIKTVQILNSSDPVYQYVRLCLNHQNNPYFPKIASVKQFPSEQGDHRS